MSILSYTLVAALPDMHIICGTAVPHVKEH